MEVPEVTFIARAPVIVSPPISTYRLSASLWSSIFDVPQVSVPSADVVMMVQLARLVATRAEPEIVPTTSSLVVGDVVPIPNPVESSNMRELPAVYHCKLSPLLL